MEEVILSRLKEALSRDIRQFHALTQTMSSAMDLDDGDIDTAICNMAREKRKVLRAKIRAKLLDCLLDAYEHVLLEDV